MTLLKILTYPDKRLRTIAQPVNKIDKRILNLVDNMAETMYNSSGIGLAATQVNIHERLIIVDISEKQNMLHVLINPEITWTSCERVVGKEGCLSLPNIIEYVERYRMIHVKALNIKSELLQFSADSIFAVCIQHEMDHLLGKIFLDRLSLLKQTRIRIKIKKHFS